MDCFPAKQGGSVLPTGVISRSLSQAREDGTLLSHTFGFHTTPWGSNVVEYSIDFHANLEGPGGSIGFKFVFVNG